MARTGNETPRRAAREDATTSLKPLVVAIGLALGIGVGSSALAVTYTVTNLSDSLPGSLRDAVTQANATIGVADVINFGAGVTGTISLATNIDVTDPLTISGPGASLLTITPPPGSYALGNGISGPNQLAISGVTFAGGLGGQAAVASQGSLTLQSCVFSNNSGTLVGAVFAYGDLVISDCTFNSNTSTDASGAGAVGSSVGTLSITNSTFSDNHGTFGAIISSYDTFVMTNSTISGNIGRAVGGVYIVEMTAPAEIRNSTLSGNVATSGPAGAIYAGNHTASSPLNLTSTIVANSTSSPGTIDIASAGGTTTINATNSLIENVGVGTINGANTANIFGVDPLLGLLQNNGGPTKTQALLPGSPAIDTGSNPLALTTDQRGAGFARTVGSATDIGAYEVQAAPVPPVPTATSIPTLSEWGTLVLAALLGGATLFTGLGRRRRDG